MTKEVSRTSNVEEPRGSENRMSLGFTFTILILTFTLPFFIEIYGHTWQFFHAFFYSGYNFNLESFTFFVFATPLDSILFWFPGVYMAFEVYRSRKNEFQTLKRFLTKILIATVFLLFLYSLLILSISSPPHPLLIPVPIATILSTIYGVRYLPEAVKTPWVEPID